MSRRVAKKPCGAGKEKGENQMERKSDQLSRAKGERAYQREELKDKMEKVKKEKRGGGKGGGNQEERTGSFKRGAEREKDLGQKNMDRGKGKGINTNGKKFHSGFTSMSCHKRKKRIEKQRGNQLKEERKGPHKRRGKNWSTRRKKGAGKDNGTTSFAALLTAAAYGR